MITNATCLWCQKPIELGIICWKHTDGLAYAWDGHAATPDPNKPPYTEGEGRACLRAPGSASGAVGPKPSPSLKGGLARRR